MNAFLKKSLVAALALAGVPAVYGEAPKTPAPKPAPPRSTFVIPASPRDGRDPFFPESSRPYEEAISATHKVDATAFIVKGLSIQNGRAMVIINNHTFALGDEGDVLTTSGRVHLRLVEVHQDVIVIEANGTRRELSIANK